MTKPAILKYLLIVAWLAVAVSVGAQTFDDIVARNPRVDCWDVAHNVVPIIGDLYSKGKIDSIYLFLDYWESKCRRMEATHRLRTILDIRTGHFHADSISNISLELMIAYRNNLAIPFNYYYPETVDILERTKQYDSLTQKIASETLPHTGDEALILEFYSSQAPTFENIRTSTEPSRLKAVYDEMYTMEQRRPLFRLAFITGAVHHYGNIVLFGTRPHFGFSMGAKWMQQNLDLVLDFRAGPSKEPYSFIYHDSLITHKKWTGMYLGLEYTYDIIQTDKVTIGVSPGIGYDRITTLTIDNDYGEEAGFVSGFNKNAGLVLTYRFGDQGPYAGLHVRYNWVSYDNPGGTFLDGGYLNVRLVIGSISDYWQKGRLKSME